MKHHTALVAGEHLPDWIPDHVELVDPGGQIVAFDKRVEGGLAPILYSSPDVFRLIHPEATVV